MTPASWCLTLIYVTTFASRLEGGLDMFQTADSAWAKKANGQGSVF